jgi:tyrosyl-tRNA synthetase
VLHKFIEFIITRDENNGGNIEFSKYEDLESSFASMTLHPADLKASVETYINRLLEPIRKTFQTTEMKKLVATAYPPPSKNSKPFIITS